MLLYFDPCRSFCELCNRAFCREKPCFREKDGICNFCFIAAGSESNEITRLRSEAIRGSHALFNNCENSVDIWKAPTWKLSVFVSSTFTDTHLERNFLMDELLPTLKKRGRKSGIEVTFSDMR